MAVEIALPDVLAEAVDLVGEDAVIPQASSWRPRYDGSAADSIGESGPNPKGLDDFLLNRVQVGLVTVPLKATRSRTSTCVISSELKPDQRRTTCSTPLFHSLQPRERFSTATLDVGLSTLFDANSPDEIRSPTIAWSIAPKVLGPPGRMSQTIKVGANVHVLSAGIEQTVAPREQGRPYLQGFGELTSRPHWRFTGYPSLPLHRVASVGTNHSASVTGRGNRLGIAHSGGCALFAGGPRASAPLWIPGGAFGSAQLKRSASASEPAPGGPQGCAASH